MIQSVLNRIELNYIEFLRAQKKSLIKEKKSLGLQTLLKAERKKRKFSIDRLSAP